MKIISKIHQKQQVGIGDRFHIGRRKAMECPWMILNCALLLDTLLIGQCLQNHGKKMILTTGKFEKTHISERKKTFKFSYTIGTDIPVYKIIPAPII